MANKESLRKWQIYYRLFALALITALVPTLPDDSGNTLASRAGVELSTRSLDLQAQEDASQQEIQLQRLSNSTDNPHYRSYPELVRTALTTFQAQHPEISLQWNQSPNYISDYKVGNILLSPASDTDRTPVVIAILNSLDNPQQLLDLSNQVRSGLPAELQEVVTDAQDNLLNLQGTQLVAEFGHDRIPHDIIDEYFATIQSDLEDLYQQKQELLTFSDLMSYFLIRTEGDIDGALFELAAFMKSIIRGHSRLGEVEQFDWVTTHLLDQINPHFSFNSFPPFASLDSRKKAPLVESVLGLGYHGPHLLALTSVFSPSTIAAAVWYEYDSMNHEVGEYKRSQDFKTLRDLPELYAFLREFR